jgi:hypothetical protein
MAVGAVRGSHTVSRPFGINPSSSGGKTSTEELAFVLGRVIRAIVVPASSASITSR